jgi:hypothetical protein
MKKLLNFKNIAIAALIIYVLLQWFNPGGVMPGGRTIRIDGKKYEVLKHTIDTIEVEKVKVVTKKGEDIVHEVIDVDTLVLKELVNVDSAAILRDYLAKVVYKDTLILDGGLGTIALTDTITKNRILGRTWDAKVKERIIKEEMIVKEPARNQVYYGLNAGFNREDYVSAVGAGLILKTKKDKIYNLNIGVNNRTVDGTNGSFSPYVGFGTYWKIKVKK